MKNCGILESSYETCDGAIKMWACKKDESNSGRSLFVPIFLHLIMEFAFPMKLEGKKTKKSLFERLQIAEWCCESYF